MKIKLLGEWFDFRIWQIIVFLLIMGILFYIGAIRHMEQIIENPITAVVPFIVQTIIAFLLLVVMFDQSHIESKTEDTK